APGLFAPASRADSSISTARGPRTQTGGVSDLKETQNRVSIIRGVGSTQPHSSTTCGGETPFAPWPSACKWKCRLQRQGKGGDSAIPQTSTGSRNDRRVPDDALADGAVGELPAT